MGNRRTEHPPDAVLYSDRQSGGFVNGAVRPLDYVFTLECCYIKLFWSAG